ncbi:MAG: hypothetical protein HC769_16315 [Cyanobacteria bacterium CRU_2_1]|nr:hypothetical protein [Cyanobacteria bacterium CRU_2_1]
MGIAAKDSIPDLVEILQDDTLQKTPEGRDFIDEILSSLVTISEATQAQIESKDIEQFKSNLESTLNTIQKNLNVI